MPRVGVLPPLAPGIGRAAVRRPLDRRREVADHRVEPDVDPLVVALVVAGHRDADAPVEVARDRPRPELLDQLEREALDVRSASAAARSIHSASRSANAGRSRKRCAVSRNTGGCAVDLRARVDQVDGIELVAAVVALVAARVREPADRARALDVAIRAACCPVAAENAPSETSLDDVAVLPERAEQIADDRVVVRRRRAREEVVGEPEPSEVVADDGAVAVDELTRRDTFLVCGDHDRRSVLVGPADHQHVAPARAGGSGRRCPTARRSRRRGRCGVVRSRTARPPRRGSSCAPWRPSVRVPVAPPGPTVAALAAATVRSRANAAPARSSGKPTRMSRRVRAAATVDSGTSCRPKAVMNGPERHGRVEQLERVPMPHDPVRWPAETLDAEGLHPRSGCARARIGPRVWRAASTADGPTGSTDAATRPLSRSMETTCGDAVALAVAACVAPPAAGAERRDGTTDGADRTDGARGRSLPRACCRRCQASMPAGRERPTGDAGGRLGCLRHRGGHLLRAGVGSDVRCDHRLCRRAIRAVGHARWEESEGIEIPLCDRSLDGRPDARTGPSARPRRSVRPCRRRRLPRPGLRVRRATSRGGRWSPRARPPSGARPTRPWVGTTPTNVTVRVDGRDDVLVRRAADVDPSMLARRRTHRLRARRDGAPLRAAATTRRPPDPRPRARPRARLQSTRTRRRICDTSFVHCAGNAAENDSERLRTSSTKTTAVRATRRRARFATRLRGGRRRRRRCAGTSQRHGARRPPPAPLRGRGGDPQRRLPGRSRA